MGRMRVLVGIVCALSSGALAVLTLITPAWIESVVGVDPDHGSGTMEAAIVACLAIGCVASTLVVRRLLLATVEE